MSSTRFKPLNADDEKSKTYKNMEAKADKIISKVARFLASLMMTLFSGAFALIAICALITSIVEKDFFSVIITCIAALVAWILWDLR